MRTRLTRRFFPLLCVTLGAIAVARVNAAEWLATWGASPVPPTPAMGPFPASPAFAGQTLRQVVRISAGGQRVRVRFSNEYGTKELLIGAARIAIADENGVPQPGTDRALTFSGQKSTAIPAGAPLLSDPVALPVKALSRLSVSIYLPEDTGPCTCHPTAIQTGYVSEHGDFTDAPFTPKETILTRAFIFGVQVEATTPAKVIAILGDSISDGLGSTNDANRRWPDLLAERLAARPSREVWGVVNLGISGNRLLNDGAGQNALARFDRDVLSLPGLSYVVVFLGINDIGLSYFNIQDGPMAAFFKAGAPKHKATSPMMIAGYRQLIQRAHARGVKVFGATITPYEGAASYSSDGEAVRNAVNQWIRTGGEFDAVLDFDAVIRDPTKPTQMLPSLHAGDHLHGNDAGYEAVARSIDLAIFK